MDVPRCPSMSLVVPRCPWKSLDVHGCPSVSLDVPQCLWMSLGVPGCPLVSVDVPRCPWMSLCVPGCPSRASKLIAHAHMYVYIYVYVCIFTHICAGVCTPYFCVYIHLHTYIYIYIYVHITRRPPTPIRVDLPSPTARNTFSEVARARASAPRLCPPPPPRAGRHRASIPWARPTPGHPPPRPPPAPPSVLLHFLLCLLASLLAPPLETRAARAPTGKRRAPSRWPRGGVGAMMHARRELSGTRRNSSAELVETRRNPVGTRRNSSNSCFAFVGTVLCIVGSRRNSPAHVLLLAPVDIPELLLVSSSSASVLHRSLQRPS